MGKTKLTAVFKTMQTAVSKHSPEILTGIGIAGMITTTILAVRATPKAMRLIEDYEECVLRDHEKIKPVDAVKLTWKCYIPAVVTGTTSIACLIGASSVNARRNAALATAYKLSETALTEYREKVIETIGEKKEKEVRNKVAEERIKKDPVSKSEVYITQKGNTLCYDYMSGRYFESDIELIKKAINKISGVMLRDDYVSLNDFYDEIGLKHVGIGDEFGWNVGRVGRDLIEPCISYGPADDAQPCAVIAFEPMPQPGFTDYM